MKDIRRISFNKAGYDLEEIIKLIYFDKTSPVLGVDLYVVIDFLRKHSKSILKIGYADNNFIRIYLKLEPQELESKEIIILNKFSS